MTQQAPTTPAGAAAKASSGRAAIAPPPAPYAFVILNLCKDGATLDGELVSEALPLIRDALEEQADTLSMVYGGPPCRVRIGASTTDREPGEIAMNVRPTLQDEAPGADAFHQVTDGVPDIEDGIDENTTTTTGNGSLSQALSHEFVETIVDPGANGWETTADGTKQTAREAADPVQNTSYLASNGVTLSNFLYPSAWVPGAPGPWDLCGVMKTQDDISNGYVIEATSPTDVSDVMGGEKVIARTARLSDGRMVRARGEPGELDMRRKSHPWSRTSRRGVNLRAGLEFNDTAARAYLRSLARESLASEARNLERAKAEGLLSEETYARVRTLIQEDLEDRRQALIAAARPPAGLRGGARCGGGAVAGVAGVAAGAAHPGRSAGRGPELDSGAARGDEPAGRPRAARAARAAAAREEHHRAGVRARQADHAGRAREAAARAAACAPAARADGEPVARRVADAHEAPRPPIPRSRRRSPRTRRTRRRSSPRVRSAPRGRRREPRRRTASSSRRSPRRRIGARPRRRRTRRRRRRGVSRGPRRNRRMRRTRPGPFPSGRSARSRRPSIRGASRRARRRRDARSRNRGRPRACRSAARAAPRRAIPADPPRAAGGEARTCSGRWSSWPRSPASPWGDVGRRQRGPRGAPFPWLQTFKSLRVRSTSARALT